MFGSSSSSSFNNIFGGIGESHQRLFGGDRALATKDIEGAQPRKYNKHVWGNYDTTPYNSGPSIDPSKSSIKSPIFGDNIQPLNRAVPNSSGLIFRSSQPQGQLTQSAVVERRQAQTGENFARDPQFQKAPTQQPISSAGFQLQERYRVKNITPASQLKEQNIFSSPAYASNDINIQKPLISSSLNQDKLREIAMLKEKMERHKLVHSNFPQKILASHRSPEAYVQSLAPKQEGNPQQTSQPNLYIEKQIVALQKNPIFAQNRNYGPDSVLFNSLSAANVRLSQQLPDSIQNLRNQLSRPASNQINQNLNSQHEQQSYQPQQQQQQQQQPPPQQQQSQQQWRQQQESVSVPQPPLQSQIQAAEKSHIYQEQDAAYLNQQNARYKPPSPFIQERNERNAEAERQFRNSARSQREPHINNLASSLLSSHLHHQNDIHQDPITGAYPKPASRGLYSQNGENRQLQSSDQLRQRTGIRTALSSRGRMVLNQGLGLKKQTSNADYGIYLDYTKGGDLIIPKEKVLYQSKRDNFIRSHTSRAQSAEGARYSSDIGQKLGSGGLGVGQNISSILNQGSTLSALKKVEQYGVNDYNIVRNVAMVPRVESPLKNRGGNQLILDGFGQQNSARFNKDDAIDQEILRSKGGPSSDAPSMQQRSLEQELIKSNKNVAELQALKRSGTTRSPAAGVQNEYSEQNLKSVQDSNQQMLERQQSVDGNGIKFFGGKALKNLSNIKIY